MNRSKITHTGMFGAGKVLANMRPLNWIEIDVRRSKQEESSAEEDEEFFNLFTHNHQRILCGWSK